MEEIIQKFKNLKNWIISNGGKINQKLTIRGTPENRYIVASDKIEKDEQLIEIPELICLTESKLSTIPNAKQLPEKIVSLHKMFILLLYHLGLGENSLFYNYINFLPSLKDYAYHPIYDVKPEWEKYSKVIYNNFKNVYDGVLKSFEEFQKIENLCEVIPKELITLDNFRWCYFVVNTRRWSIGLVPFADLLQHSGASKVALNFDATKKSINMVQKEVEIQKDALVYDTYGVKPDSLLLQNYGFVDRTISEPFAVINVKIEDPKNTFDKIQCDMLKEYAENKMFTIFEKSLKTQTIEFLRILRLSKEDFPKIADLGKDFYTKAFLIENEFKALSSLMELCKGIEKDYSEEEIKLCKETLLDETKKGTIEYDISKIVVDNLKISAGTKLIAKEYWTSFLK